MIYLTAFLGVALCITVLAFRDEMKQAKILEEEQVRFKPLRLESFNIIATFFDGETIEFQSKWFEVYSYKANDILRAENYIKDGVTYPRSAFKSIKLSFTEKKKCLLSIDYPYSNHSHFVLNNQELNKAIDTYDIIILETFKDL